ncbi:Sensor histidine kinase RcsC [Tautonia plasticadhaerens]|uniref:histidine kinase n=2 Tax=Tautonia plasticadhaerens TaxID=2527974 RepID=A0A518H3A5_9BACT|nr:Sensor histidine kinase RcsC [Tautonia plasticadhaerens]
MGISDLMAWFAGGSQRYMTLYHCMNQDLPWVILTVALDLAVASGYALIALHWWREQRNSSMTVAQHALKNMKNIFVFCGICGYLFIPIKMVWPAWRLYDLFLAVLAFYTWRYAWNARELKVIYHELTRTERLVHQLDEERAESRRKSLFLNSISHDLRTPLNGLMLQAQLAEMELGDLPLSAEQVAGQREALTVIRSNAKAVAALLDRLLEYGRVEGGEESFHPIAFDLDDLVNGVVGRFRAVAGEKRLTLEVSSPPGLSVYTDATILERIVSNLVDNALKFTHAGGVRLDVERTGDSVAIHVADMGPGIAPEHLGRIFDDFFQVGNDERDRTKGFGLGLAITRRLARQLGGDVGVSSRVGSGSRFTVVLPGVVARRDAVVPAEAAAGRG